MKEQGFNGQLDTILESATNFWLLVLSILHNHAAQPRQPYYQANVTITLGRRVKFKGLKRLRPLMYTLRPNVIVMLAW